MTVNGEKVLKLGTKANPEIDNIVVDDKTLDPGSVSPVYYLLNKPRGCVCTTSDPQGRPTVMDLLSDVPQRVYPVGRLDYASEGLLLFTNDGDTANKLIHPSSQIPKTYAVKIRGKFPEEKLKTLINGIPLSGGTVKPVKVERGKGLQRKEWIRVTVQEGRNLEIRRLFAFLGYEVDRLRRVQFGNLDIDRLPVGKYRVVSRKEIQSILEHKPTMDAAPTAAIRKKRKLVPHTSRRGR